MTQWDIMGWELFLHDVIKKEEDIDLDMGDSNGFILGIAPDLPWYYSENIRNLTNDMFCALIAKYVKKISDHVPAVQMWDCSAD